MCNLTIFLRDASQKKKKKIFIKLINLHRLAKNPKTY